MRLGRIGCGWEDNIKMNLRRKRVCDCGLGANAMAYSFEHNPANSGGGGGRFFYT
jgi:hypothetical protein